MRLAELLGWSLLGVALPLAGCGSGADADFDLLIRGATLLDGTGAPPRQADLGIREGRIVALGPLRERTAEREIDAGGLIVAPGFIDLHSHADLILLADDRRRLELLEAKIRQGVTTLIVGNCGLGVAPTDAGSADVIAKINAWMTPTGVRTQALNFGEYLTTIERLGVPLNVGALLPHGPLRISVVGARPGAPSSTELDEMRQRLRRGLESGALGLSTGLIYPPGMYSATDELIELARVVADKDRLFTSHIRGSSETLIPATNELLRIARESGARVHHSHMEAVGERFWDRIPEMLRLEDEARAAGARVSHDVFVYTRAATMMSAIFPPWSHAGGPERLLERLADPAQRARIARDIREQVPQWPTWREGGWPHNLVRAVGWDSIRIASVADDGARELVGRTIDEIARERGSEPFDVVAELMLSQRGRVGQQVGEISGREDRLDALLQILTHPAAAVISDAEDYGRGSPHPAHAGAFARVLRLNRERGLLPLQELIRRMTAHPAAIAGLHDRGTIRRDAPADLVLFDPVAVVDRASWSDPRGRAGGIPYVIVNGVIVVDGGRYLGGLPGQVLRATTASARPSVDRREAPAS